MIWPQILLNLGFWWGNRIPALTVSAWVRGSENWTHRKMSYELKALDAYLLSHPRSCAISPTPFALSGLTFLGNNSSLPLDGWWKSKGNNRRQMVVFLGEISEISRRPCSYYMTNEYCFPSLHSSVGSSIEPGLGQLWYWFPFVISDSLLK